jgi:hypothetical protein
MPERHSAFVRAFLFLAIVVSGASTSACRGLLAPVDSDAGDAGEADGGDASTASDAESDAADASIVDAKEPDADSACDYDAADDASLCTPPANDLLFANPASIQVAAGSYGLATFVATGPWATDPMMYMHYEGSSFQVRNFPYIMTYGTPQSLSFLVPSTAAGQHGTLTVSGHAGNIERTATVSVTVTSCAPSTAYCVGDQCGFEDDGCGGVISCGTCSGATPSCFVYQCVANGPPPCPAGSGYDVCDGGPCTDKCVPCATTHSCEKCGGGYCDSLNNVCFCHYPGGTPPPPR